MYLIESKKAVKSIFIIIILSFGSKIFGVLREILIAAKFGSSTETDTFFIAIAATSLFTAMLTQTLNTTTIPIMAEIEKKEGKVGKKEHTSNLLNIVFLLSLVIVVLAWVSAPLIIKLLAYGFEGDQFNLAVTMLRIGLPAIFFAGIVGVFRGYLQSEEMFAESAASQYPFNITYIIFLVFFSSIFGIKGLMVSSVLAIGSQILVQIPSIKKTGYSYKFIFDLKDKYNRKIIHLSLPILLSVAINDLNKIVDRSLASTLVEGSVSALNYGNRLKSLILDIFIVAITTVIFPTLSKEANKESHDGFKKIMRYGFNTIILITIPATVGTIVLSEPIVRIVFERGAFDETATYMTTGALTFYSLGLTGMGLRTFLNRAYYSLQDTKTPMYNGFIAVGLNILLNFILITFMQHRGLALATSISATLTSVLLLYGLKKKIGALGTINMIKCSLKSLCASLVMGTIVYISYNYSSNIINGSTLIELALLIGVSILGVLIYSGIIYALKVEELNWFFNTIKNKNRNKVI